MLIRLYERLDEIYMQSDFEQLSSLKKQVNTDAYR